MSADLTRTSERRLQAGKILGFEVLSSRFPYYIFGLKSGRTQDAITDSMAHVHGTARQLPAASMAVAAVPLMLAAAEKVPAAARSGLTRRPAVQCPSGILPLPRACSCGCCSPSTQAKETLMEGVSVSSIIEDEKASEKDASKNRAP